MEKISLSKIQAEKMVDALLEVEQEITGAARQAPWLPTLPWCRKLENVHSWLLAALDEAECVAQGDGLSAREGMGNDGKG